jgi:NRPS condensation-like uncharacterized protein
MGRHLPSDAFAPVPARRLDALAEAFVRLADHANVNTNQIFVVEGRVDVARLERSVRRAVADIDLLQMRPVLAGNKLARPDAAPGQLVWQQDFDGRCDLQDPMFRRQLMAFSDRSRIDWRQRAPIQVLLVTGCGGATSCVYISTHHSVADARSDCLLTQAIMHYYAQECGERERPAPPALPFDELQRIRPRWYSTGAKLRRWLDAAASVAGDLLRRDHGVKVAQGGSRWERHAVRSDIAELDFFHSVFSPQIEARLKQASKTSGATINSILTAALVRTIEHSQGRPDGVVRVTCAVSLRRLIESKYDHSFRNYLVASGIRVRAGQSSARLLQAVQAGVQRARTERSLLKELGRIELLLLLLRPRWLAGLALPLINRSQGSNACYSNPGVIEEDFSFFGATHHRTLQYIGFGCVVPPYDFILYTPTVNGRMQLDLVYRRACFPDVKTTFIDVFHAALAHILEEIAPEAARPHGAASAQPELESS